MAWRECNGDYTLRGVFRLVAIEAIVDHGILVVRLQGEIDHHAAEQMRTEIEQQLAETRYQGIVISFRNIDFMDSSGLGLILGRYRTVTERGGKMALAEVNGTLRKIFDMSGLLKILPVFETEEDAIRAVRGV